MIITSELFAYKLQQIILSDIVPHFVVGLSGGADSLCLTMLLNEYVINNSGSLFACIVDHRLRPQSSTEIIPIIGILKQNNIDYCVKIWKHDDIIGNIEMKARIARYNMLYEYCKEVKANFLCTAHHGLDQWETFFMRLSRGSGLRGLTAINPITDFKDIKLIRPLLDFSPEDLKETLLRRFNISDHVHDEMNDDIKYERVRWRKSYSTLCDNYGLSTTSIGQTINRLKLANDCLDCITKNILTDIFDGSYIKLKIFKQQHLELRIRILDSIVQTLLNRKRILVLDNNPYHRIISHELLVRAATELITKGFRAVNFAGLVFKKDSTKNIKVYFENRRSKH